LPWYAGTTIWITNCPYRDSTANGKWDVEWHFHILKFDGENNYAKKNNL
jgi:hypothetical protein